MTNYANNYINGFFLAVKESKYKVNGERKDVESFFQELNMHIKKVNKNKGRFYCLCSGSVFRIFGFKQGKKRGC